MLAISNLAVDDKNAPLGSASGSSILGITAAQIAFMASHPLQNYLRMTRRQSGLSQEDVAFLLGSEEGSRVCRHEQFASKPTIEVALAYEVIFQKSVRDLFAGFFAKIERGVAERAMHLTAQLDAGERNHGRGRKLLTLTAITARHVH